jgi:hypothetical protein
MPHEGLRQPAGGHRVSRSLYGNLVSQSGRGHHQALADVGSSDIADYHDHYLITYTSGVPLARTASNETPKECVPAITQIGR